MTLSVPVLVGDERGDVRNEQTHEKLSVIGGGDQIPFLVDTGRDAALYGSDEIIAYPEDYYE